jgi:hypothetical protein
VNDGATRNINSNLKPTDKGDIGWADSPGLPIPDGTIQASDTFSAIDYIVYTPTDSYVSLLSGSSPSIGKVVTVTLEKVEWNESWKFDQPLNSPFQMDYTKVFQADFFHGNASNGTPIPFSQSSELPQWVDNSFYHRTFVQVKK